MFEILPRDRWIKMKIALVQHLRRQKIPAEEGVETGKRIE
jgi:hypothetical protein